MIDRRAFVVCTIALFAGAIVGGSAVWAEDPKPEETTKPADMRLLGKWQSDAERSMKFVEEESNATDKAKDVLRQLLGKMTVEYSDDACVMAAPAQTLKGANGKVVELGAWKERVAYEIIGTTEDSIAIKHVDLGKEEIVVLHFEGDHYWIYDALTHSREYFKRLR